MPGLAAGSPDREMTYRKLLQSKAIAMENDLRGTLRNFGLKVGIVGKVKFEARTKELVATFPNLAALVEPLLIVRRALREQIVILHRRLLPTRERTRCAGTWRGARATHFTSGRPSPRPSAPGACCRDAGTARAQMRRR